MQAARKTGTERDIQWNSLTPMNPPGSKIMKPRNILISVAAVTTLILTTQTLSHAQLSGNWTNKANLLKQGRSLGIAVLNGKIYLAGGYCGSLCDLATLDEYDPVTDTWTNRANMQTRRYAPAAAALNGN